MKNVEEVLLKLAPDCQRKMAGNMMHLACIGQFAGALILTAKV